MKLYFFALEAKLVLSIISLQARYKWHGAVEQILSPRSGFLVQFELQNNLCGSPSYGRHQVVVV